MATSIHLKLFAVLFLFAGCAKKTVTQIEYRTRVDIQRDTVQMPTYVETIVPSPCDTNGILKDFKFETQAGPAKVKLETDGTKIIVRVRTDTIVKSYRALSDTVYVNTTEIQVKKVTPRWAWQLLVANVIIAIGILLYLRLK
jgi:hypothetical protein